MQIFINERSLHGQYSQYNIEEAIRTFLATVKLINELPINKQLITTTNFFNSTAINGVHLGGILEANRQLKATFFYNVKNFIKWEDTIQHDTHTSYTHNNIDYVNYSIAEITERKIREAELKAFLLNFIQSIFQTLLHIDVVKLGNATTAIDCAFDIDSVNNWLINNNFIDPNAEYSVDSRRPPFDYQTVLANPDHFEATALRNQGRKVFRRIGSNELWVIDNLHYGTDAHIEVFDETTKKHKGTSPINNITVETKYKVKDRFLE